MGEKIKRRAVYMVTIAAMVAMTGGFVLATTITALTAPPAQGGGFATTGTPPVGVTNSEILISQAVAPAIATSNSIGVPAALTATTGNTTDVIDVNTVGAMGDFVETVTLTFSASLGAPASTEYAVSIVITGSTGAPQIVYVETNSGFSASGVDTVNFVWDMGSGSSGITISSVSDLITQCPSVGVCS
jgi:hypothetical protein